MLDAFASLLYVRNYAGASLTKDKYCDIVV